MGLIDEILHYVVHLFRREMNKDAMKEALDSLYEALGRAEVDQALSEFTDEFPPLPSIGAKYLSKTIWAASPRVSRTASLRWRRCSFSGLPT